MVSLRSDEGGEGVSGDGRSRPAAHRRRPPGDNTGQHEPVPGDGHGRGVGPEVRPGGEVQYPEAYSRRRYTSAHYDRDAGGARPDDIPWIAAGSAEARGPA